MVSWAVTYFTPVPLLAAAVSKREERVGWAAANSSYRWFGPAPPGLAFGGQVALDFLFLFVWLDLLGSVCAAPVTVAAVAALPESAIMVVLLAFGT